MFTIVYVLPLFKLFLQLFRNFVYFCLVFNKKQLRIMKTEYKDFDIDYSGQNAIIYKNEKFIKGFTTDYLGLPTEVPALEKCKNYIDSI